MQIRLTMTVCVFALLLGVCMPVAGQISYYVTNNYSSRVAKQNNEGKFIKSFKDSQVDAVDLSRIASNYVVTFVYTVVLSGNDPRGIKQLVEVYSYTYIAGHCIPIGGSRITVLGFHPKNPNIWYASTNPVPASQMAEFDWEPSDVGSKIESDDQSRTVWTCSSIFFSARNDASTSRIFWVPCITNTRKSFNWPFRFSSGQIQEIPLTVSGAMYEFRGTIGSFTFFSFTEPTVSEPL